MQKSIILLALFVVLALVPLASAQIIPSENARFGGTTVEILSAATATITIDIPEQLQNPLQKQVQRVIPELTTITFNTTKTPPKKETTTQA